MYILTIRKNDKYYITDTKDGIEDCFTGEEVKEALKLGFNILGCKLKNNSVIMTEEMKYINLADYTGLPSYYEQNIERLDSDENCAFIKNDKDIKVYKDDELFCNVNITKKLLYISYADYYNVNNKDFIIIHLEYYDKHYYEEDCGKEFYECILISKNKVIEDSGILLDIPSSKFNFFIKDNKILFNGKTIDLGEI